MNRVIVSKYICFLLLLLLLPLYGSCRISLSTDDAAYRIGEGISYTPPVIGEAQFTFTLPVEENDDTIYEGSLSEDYPEVDWQSLDRLYIPAGEYSFIHLGGLPDRTPEAPLVISNTGGQVKVSGDHYYAFSISGGRGWVLTGAYDADLQTGDENYPGHASGYGDSAGRYGIEINDVNASGIGVGGGASNFELSHIEIAHAGFAGILIKTDGEPGDIMHSVSIHDLYIHDSESEGMYIGNTSKNAGTQHAFTHLKVYNNRVIRSGTEGIQLSHMADGVEIYNNLVFLNAVRWKNPFMIYQDGCLQYMARSGHSSVHDNIFIGGASALFTLRFIAAPDEILAPGDGVEIYNNYFSHGRNWFSYLHTDETNHVSGLRFRNNVIREINYHYDELPDNSGETDPGIIFRNTNNRSNPMTFENNEWNGGEQFLQWIDGTSGSGSVEEENTIFRNNALDTSLPSISFTGQALPGGEDDYSRVEYWVPYSDLYDFYPAYEQGDLVIWEGRYYRCIQPVQYSDPNPTEPGNDTAHWEDCGLLTDFDNFLSAAGSEYSGMGIY